MFPRQREDALEQGACRGAPWSLVSPQGHLPHLSRAGKEFKGWVPSLWLTTARKASPSMTNASQSLALCVVILWYVMNFSFLWLHLYITENS